MRVAINHLDRVHSWVDLCERAFCSPDFDVVYGYGRADAVAWLEERLARYGHTHSVDEIGAAYDAWPPEAGGVAVKV